VVGLIEDDGEIIFHYVLVPHCRPNDILIEGDPVLEVLFAIILLELL
jgi:hypothetical protein